MKSWFTTAELAALTLPGFPESRKGWDSLAKRNGWLVAEGKARRRRGSGGGFEFHVDLLPDGALGALAAKVTGAVVVPEDDRILSEAAPGADALTAAAMDHRDARLALLAAVDRFTRGAQLTVSTADTTFCALYNAGEIAVDDWVRHAVPEASPRSLKRWRSMRASGQLGRLAVDRGAGRRG